MNTLAEQLQGVIVRDSGGPAFRAGDVLVPPTGEPHVVVAVCGREPRVKLLLRDGSGGRWVAQVANLDAWRHLPPGSRADRGPRARRLPTTAAPVIKVTA